MKRHMNFFVKVEPNKQVSFDSIENAEIFMFDMWNRGDVGVTLYQIDPDYQETDQLAPAYASVLHLINSKLYQQRIEEISTGFTQRHHPLVKGKLSFKQFMKSNIKQVRFYRELGGKV